MCGIVGFLNTSSINTEYDSNLLVRRMTDTLHHRGPNSGGYWTDSNAHISLGHRRLAIQDLTASGNQPMVSSCGRFVIVYNGEVYNAEDFRPETPAAGGNYRGHSDTEAIIEGCATQGMERTVERLIGMFAFAIWDRRERILTIYRDRFGIKPLYWGHSSGIFAFASELKALKCIPGFVGNIDRQALSQYVHFGYIPDPFCIYENIQKLSPGHCIQIKSDGQIKISCYWDSLGVARQGLADPLTCDAQEVENRLEDLLCDAVKRRLLSDVSLGAFLSGGIDSSLVVALMQKTSPDQVRTFSIGFNEECYNEAPHAKLVAKHLGTCHTELYITSKQAQSVIPELANIYDEPFADSSQIPTCLVSRLAKKHVTVVLSGDGGDEFFAGYSRYHTYNEINKIRQFTPAWMRRLLGRTLRSLPLGNRLRRLGEVLPYSLGQFYKTRVIHWPCPKSLVIGGGIPLTLFDDESLSRNFPNEIEYMQYLDTMTYLPGDILTKVDRASMKEALEVRVPLLDHRVYAMSWRIPMSMKVQQGVGKQILRNILYRYIPRSLVDRPKMGFGVPLDDWLRGPLRSWAESLIDPSRLRTEGFFNPELVWSCWQRHLKGENWEYWVWTILMFQCWHENHAKHI